MNQIIYIKIKWKTKPIKNHKNVQILNKKYIIKKLIQIFLIKNYYLKVN